MTFSAVLYLALRHVDNFDEGFMLTGAMMIAEGKLPYRDFITMYGPGQYVLYAGAFILFGQSMMVAKLLHALLFSGLIMTQTALALRLSGYGWRAALAVWAVLFGLAVDINVPSTIAI